MAFYGEDGDKLNVQDFVEIYSKGYLNIFAEGSTRV